jgi:RNA polymerase sigma factor (sigma-70 family)
VNIGYAAPAAGTLDRVEVVEAARAGCDTAWRQIFDEHYPQMYRFFRARVSSHEEAEDLAAEVFAQAVRCIRKFEWQGRPFGSWLYGIARRQLA